MTFNKFETNSYCVGGRHISATKNIYGSITSKGNKVSICYCSICNGKKSMAVSDNTIKRKTMPISSKILVKKDCMYQKDGKKRIK